MSTSHSFNILFFFNDTATTEIYTLSLHDALPISGAPTAAHRSRVHHPAQKQRSAIPGRTVHHNRTMVGHRWRVRSEEHTSELQSQSNLVCRLLLEKKKKNTHKKKRENKVKKERKQ